jgi:hypothetical protein
LDEVGESRDGRGAEEGRVFVLRSSRSGSIAERSVGASDICAIAENDRERERGDTVRMFDEVDPLLLGRVLLRAGIGSDRDDCIPARPRVPADTTIVVVRCGAPSADIIRFLEPHRRQQCRSSRGE